MATEAEARLLRRSIGYEPDDTVSFSQAEADQLFEDVALVYPDNISLAETLPLASIMYFEELLVNSAKMYTYRQNNNQKNLSDIFQHVKDLIAYQNEKLLQASTAIASEQGSVRSGKPIRIVGRYREDIYGY